MKAADPFYLSKQWKKVRLDVIRRDKWRCQQCNVLCLGKKRDKPTAHVDHLVARKDRPDLALSMNNLQTLCAPCHSRKTRADEHDKPEIGLDGYAIEA